MILQNYVFRNRGIAPYVAFRTPPTFQGSSTSTAEASLENVNVDQATRWLLGKEAVPRDLREKIHRLQMRLGSLEPDEKVRVTWLVLISKESMLKLSLIVWKGQSTLSMQPIPQAASWRFH